MVAWHHELPPGAAGARVARLRGDGGQGTEAARHPWRRQPPPHVAEAESRSPLWRFLVPVVVEGCQRRRGRCRKIWRQSWAFETKQRRDPAAGPVEVRCGKTMVFPSYNTGAQPSLPARLRHASSIHYAGDDDARSGDVHVKGHAWRETQCEQCRDPAATGSPHIKHGGWGTNRSSWGTNRCPPNLTYSRRRFAVRVT